MQLATIGIDIAKHVFPVHGVSENGQVILRKRLRRAEVLRFFRQLDPCLIGMEACATSPYWAHELEALGQRVKLMPPTYVKAYIRRNKNDAADAEAVESQLIAWHRADETSRRLASIPGVGPVTASAIAATVGGAGQFKSGREFAAWLGLTPRQKASGSKNVLSGISKRGDKYIRRLLISGAVAIIRYSRAKPTVERAWVHALLQRRPAKVVAVALANKTARIIWALMTKKAQ